MKYFNVVFGFDVAIEAENKDEALELARAEVNKPGYIYNNLCCDGVQECDESFEPLEGEDY